MINTKDIINRIAEELELDSFPQETQTQIIEKLGENILKKITIAVLDRLPESARSEFEALNEKGDVEKMQEFMRSNIKDIDAVVENEIRKNIEEFKNMKNELSSE